MSLSGLLNAIWYEGRPIPSLLLPLERLYRVVVKRKRQAFLAGHTLSYRARVPVIVVGNLTVGGTGKTPVILWLANHCSQRGLRVGVVSRGYGAKPPSLPWLVRPDQSANEVGDEPLLIAQRARVPVVIDPDRARAVRRLEQEGVDLILSDDGLQHYRLARDLELVLVDAARGFGNRHCLPAGPLREPLQRLEQVDAVLCNGQAEDSAEGFGLTLAPAGLVSLADDSDGSLERFPAGQPVHAVAGIGNPERFFGTLEALDWRPIRHPFADHEAYHPEQLRFDDGLPVVMTEKDAVKCRSFAGPDWWYLKVDAVPSAGFVAWFDEQLARLTGQPSWRL
ncbi:tetraacyldisaccharide 4'-kinase [Stutzerimonas urumqiensis]|uniref:tetraacyldisaccharide 4'-kinase n=1 Tax=Stutzerimonas urumqiensis TaxID=638269 RepID=UPI003BA85CCB